ncbi:hypothetical protein GCM10027280_40690 [Micromonospora polyrhachis]
MLVAVLVALVPAGPAAAHNRLRSATPERDATLTAPPTEVVLEFAEPLNPTYTTIVVTDAARQRVATSEPVVAGTRGTVTFTEPLTDGGYTVAYRVVSADGHPVQGSYPFTVGSGPASVTTPSAASPAASTGDATSTAGSDRAASADRTASSGGGVSGGGVSAWTIAAGTAALAALLALLAGTGLLLWRRRAVRR